MTNIPGMVVLTLKSEIQVGTFGAERRTSARSQCARQVRMKAILRAAAVKLMIHTNAAIEAWSTIRHNAREKASASAPRMRRRFIGEFPGVLP